MSTISLDLTSTTERQEGRWCLRSYHCPRGSFWCWIPI